MKFNADDFIFVTSVQADLEPFQDRLTYLSPPAYEPGSLYLLANVAL